MSNYTKHALEHMGWAEIAPLEGRADTLGQFEKVQASRL